MRKVARKGKGGMIGAAALAGLIGRAALGWAVPKALDFATKKRGKKGKGVVNHGMGMYLHGSSPKKSRRGCGMYQMGAKGGHGVKDIINKLKANPTVQNLVNKGKQQAKRHLNYAIDNPTKSFNNVKKMFGGKGNKKIKTLSVKQRRVPKQKVGIESAQHGRTTSITVSRPFKKGFEVKPQSIQQIKRSI